MARELPDLLQHFHRLEEADRRSRFGRAVSESFLGSYCAEGFAGSNLLVGCFDNGLRAVGELRRGELAFSVEREWRGNGLARSLLGVLVESARRMGAPSVKAFCSAENTPMRKMLIRAGFTLSRLGPDICGQFDICGDGRALGSAR